MTIKPRNIIAGGLTAAVCLGSTQSIAEEDGWSFSVSPLYLWAKSIEGDASAGGQALPLDLAFKDEVLDNLDAALALHAEATNGTWTFFVEYNFARLDPSVTTAVGPIEIRADVEFEDTMIEGGLTWTFADDETNRWELLGGLRYYKQDVDIELSSSRSTDGPLNRDIRVGDSWVQPMVGLRYTRAMSERWSFRARGDYGYEDSNNTALNGTAFFDYRFRDWGSVFFGFRYLEIDFDNRSSRLNQYGFDGKQQGPVIGLNLHF